MFEQAMFVRFPHPLHYLRANAEFFSVLEPTMPNPEFSERSNQANEKTFRRRVDIETWSAQQCRPNQRSPVSIIIR